MPPCPYDNTEADDELSQPQINSHHWRPKSSLSPSNLVPLAGSTPYPLPADIPSTHPLYATLTYIPQDPRRLQYATYRDLVGEPGFRSGIQNKPLEDPLETPQDPDPRKWTGPEEKPRWERVCEELYYQQYTATCKIKRRRPRIPTSKAAEAGKSNGQTKQKGEFISHWKR